MSSFEGSDVMRLRGADLLLIALVTLSWGLNYPIMKFVLDGLPPLTFRMYTFGLGSLVLAIYAGVFGHSLRVPQQEWRVVLRLGVPNMVLWHLGLIYGVLLLQSGRAAMVGYTMPVWALLASVLLYRAKLERRGVIGVLSSLLGMLLLTVSELRAFGGHPWGVLSALGAAMAWGLGTAMMKNTPTPVSSFSMTFWMLVMAFVFFLVMAFVLEGHAWQWPNWPQVLGIAYAGAWAFAVCYVAWFRVARKVTPVTSGLSVVMVPVVGLIGGHVMLGESVAASDVVAMAFIALAIATVLSPSRKSG